MPMRYRKTNYALATFTLPDGKITITFRAGRRGDPRNYSEMWLEYVDGSRCKPTACYFNEFARKLLKFRTTDGCRYVLGYWRNRKLVKFITLSTCHHLLWRCSCDGETYLLFGRKTLFRYKKCITLFKEATIIIWSLDVKLHVSRIYLYTSYNINQLVYIYIKLRNIFSTFF